MFANRSGKLPIVVVIVVALVVLLAGVAVFVMKSKGGAKNHKEPSEPTSSLELGEFVVNLADAPQMHYLKTNVVIEVQGQPAAHGGGHGGGEGADPKVRDAVIQVLSSKHMAELTRPDGKERLKKDIIAAVNARMKDGKAVDVYFSEFAMQ